MNRIRVNDFFDKIALNIVYYIPVSVCVHPALSVFYCDFSQNKR